MDDIIKKAAVKKFNRTDDLVEVLNTNSGKGSSVGDGFASDVKGYEVEVKVDGKVQIISLIAKCFDASSFFGSDVSNNFFFTESCYIIHMMPNFYFHSGSHLGEGGRLL